MTTPTKEQIKRAKKVLFQVAMKLQIARQENVINDETDEFMYIVATTITEWEKIRNSPK